ncbi:hypothetical protein DB30_07967 [Enhygromyxa salina]|uniref:Uncharacterized protein n=1 Tax=Enhygromyxa salina TaxID=215803 RepID=A0A0C1Z7A4_9BACT|nr:hypothetical protein DB30_07967 [Enhygromyxa salina]
MVLARQPLGRAFSLGLNPMYSNSIWTADIGTANIIAGIGEIWTVWLDDQGGFQAQIHTRE